MRKCIVALGALVLAAASARAEENCRLTRVASLPLTVLTGGHIAVQAGVEGRPVTMAVDTGSPLSILSRSAVDALGLHEQMIANPWTTPQLYGGQRAYEYVRVKAFTLGNSRPASAEFAVMPAEAFPDVDGLIGADFLWNFDIDFDFAAAKLNIFLPHPCPGRAVYWTQDESAVSKIAMASTEHDRHVLVPIELDGVTYRAVLDTGAAVSAMNLEEAESDFHLTPSSPGMTRVADGGDFKGAYTYPFKTLTFGGVTVRNPRIFLNPEDSSKLRYVNKRVLVGISVLRQLHFYVAYQERLLYVTAASAH